MKTAALINPIVLTLVLLASFDTQAQNEVAIGSSTTKTNAILWLNGNGSQGLILPVVTNKSAVSNPDKGMIVYDDSDNKVWYRNTNAWVEVGGGTGGSTTNLNLLLQGNALQLRDGTTVLSSVNIAGGTSSTGAFLVFQGGSWQFATLSGDVTGANGALVVNGIKGKTVANLPASTQALVYNPTANSGAGGWVFQALAGGGTVTNVSGTPPLTVTNPTTTPTISLTNGGITNTLIANDAITSTKIMDGTIVDADIANTTITAGKLAQSSAANGQVLKWNGTAWAPAADDAGVSSTLTSANIFVGNASNVATAVSMSGDATLSNAGALTIANNAVTSAKILDATIVNADIANATITAGKLAQSGATNGQILKWNGTAWAPAADDAGVSSTLTSANIYVGNASNVATGVALSGDATLSNTGALTIANNAITSAKILDATIVDADIANATITAGKFAQSGAAAGQVLKWNGTTWAAAGDDGISTSLTSANILVGNASNVATGVALSGDATLSNTGTLTIANNAVTTAKIADGTITNADINAGAAIDGSKINPQFGSQFISTTGRLGLGTTTPSDLFEADGTEGKVNFHPYFPNVGTSLLGTFLGKSSKGAQIRFTGAPGFIDVGQDAAGNFVVENSLDEKILTVNSAGAIGVGNTQDFGTAGKVLTSQGPGSPATWSSTASSFSTLNRVPKGDGSTLVASSIYDNGNVGIGSTSPSTLLHTYGTTDPLIKIDGPAGSQSVLGFATEGTNKWSWYVKDGGPDLRLWHYVNPIQNYLIFDGTNGDISLAPSSGNVGIGVTAPSAKLQVAGQVRAKGGPPGGFGANNQGLVFGAGGVGDNDSGISSSADGQLEFYSNATEVMRITPGYGLEFVSPNPFILFPASSTSPMMYMFKSGTVNPTKMVLAHSPTFTNYGLQYDDATDVFSFLGAGLNRLSVNLGSGAVVIPGTLSKGSGTFKIDHPVDPENKYLYHSFVESPDMMNVYNGNILTNGDGEATIQLPDYFHMLNKDFRYQLTVIGTFAQAIVSEEITSGNTFKIKTDKPDVKVSWQVTGIRKDPFAEKNRVVPEVEKTELEKGKYLHPEAFGLPPERGINYDTKKQNQ